MTRDQINNQRRLLNIQLAQLEASFSDPNNTQSDDQIKSECWGIRQHLIRLARQEQALARSGK